MIKFYFTVIITFFFLSCSKENENINNVKNYKLANIEIESWDNNYLKSVELFREGKNDGRVLVYYKNGNLKTDREYCNNKLCNEEQVFDSLGNLRRIYRYLIQGNKSFVNEVIEFGLNGEIIKEKSRYILIDSSKDTLTLGDEHHIIVKIGASAFPDSLNVIRKVVINGMDDEYNIIDTNSLVKLEVLNGEAHIKLKATKPGNSYLKGFLLEKSSTKDNKRVGFNAIYFTYKYYVTESKKNRIGAYCFDDNFYKLIQNW